MAALDIKFDASSTGSGTAATVTVAHTVTANANRILFVATLTDTSHTVTVKYAGVDMILISSQTYSTSKTIQMFRLVTPTTGANNIVATANSGTPNIQVRGVSYYNILATGSGVDAENAGGNDGVTSQTVSVTTTLDNDWIVGSVASDNNISASTGFTARVGTGGSLAMGDSTTGVAGTYTMVTTMSAASGRWVGSSMKSPFPLTFSDTSHSADTLIAPLRAISRSVTDTSHSSDAINLSTDRWKTESKDSGTWSAEAKTL